MPNEESLALPCKMANQGVRASREHQYSFLFCTLVTDQRKVCELKQSLFLMCLPSVYLVSLNLMKSHTPSPLEAIKNWRHQKAWNKARFIIITL